MLFDNRLELVGGAQNIPPSNRPALQLAVVVQKPDDLELGRAQLVEQVQDVVKFLIEKGLSERTSVF